MKQKGAKDYSKEFEAALVAADDSSERYLLRLYVTGSTAKSAKAIQNIRSLCEERLQGRYDLEVIDIHQQPEQAGSEQIIAAPTLIKKLPSPLRKFVGDLSDIGKILAGLNLQPAPLPNGRDSHS